MSEPQKPCLHCDIWDTIWDHYRRTNGEALGDYRHALSNLGQVMAEIIAGIDDRAERRHLLDSFQAAFPQVVKDMRERGRQTPMVRPH